MNMSAFVDDWLRVLTEVDDRVVRTVTGAFNFYPHPDGLKWLNSCVTPLMERECYAQLRNHLFGEDASVNSGIVDDESLNYMLIEGKSGIGKSCCLVWIIYDIFRRARAYRQAHVGWEDDVTNSRFHSPVILYILRETSRQYILELGHPPTFIRPQDHTRISYVISDDHDVNGPEQYEQVKLVLCAASDSTKLYEFNKRAQEAMDKSNVHIFYALSFAEIKGMMFDISNFFQSLEELQFRFDVLNGNPGFIIATPRVVISNADHAPVISAVNETLLTLFGGEYVVPLPAVNLTAKQMRGLWVIKLIMANASLKAESDVHKTSLFLQYVSVPDGIVEVTETFSSKFMKMLYEIISKREESNEMINTIKLIFRYCGPGKGFEHIAHKNIVDGGVNWHAIRLLADNGGSIELPFDTLHRVSIRSIGDIASLPNFAYGIPIIPNLTVIDAIVRVGNKFYLLKVTDTLSQLINHQADLNRIVQFCNVTDATTVPEIFFVWILGDNFFDFTGTPMALDQYKTRYVHQSVQDLTSRKRQRVLPTTADEIRFLLVSCDDELLGKFQQSDLLKMAQIVGIKKKSFTNKKEILTAVRNKLSQSVLGSR